MRAVTTEGLPWLGAPLGIDLANTVIRLAEGTLDLLSTESQLDDWLAREANRLPVPRRGSGRLAEFRALRDTVHELLSARARGGEPPSRAVRRLNAAARRAPAYPALTASREAHLEHPGPGSALDKALALIARSAIELLASPEADRLRVCPAPSCGMFFLAREGQDWCSTTCGNRARSARLYARRKGGGRVRAPR